MQGVSRTFALTIPQLPDPLQTVVGNAYLWCRIADTIEDSPALALADKQRLAEKLVLALEGEEDMHAFAQEMASLLDEKSLPDEIDLAANAPRVLAITQSFTPEDQASIRRCVRVMSEGMERFQEGQFSHGLRDQAHLDEYCYYVAGIVGEMLTELFSHHCAAMADQQEELRELAISFGEGLQMTNILKDIWDDKERGVCWLPRETFARHGFDLEDLTPGQQDSHFEAALGELVAVARGHLENALTYTTRIPRSEQGIRQFCLWAIGMAVLTLKNINCNRGFNSGADVKISRKKVRRTVALSRLFGRSNSLLQLLFSVAAAGLPPAQHTPINIRGASRT